MFLSLSNWLFVKNRFVWKYFQNEFHLHMDWGVVYMVKRTQYEHVER